MSGVRNDNSIAEALESLAQEMAQNQQNPPNAGGNDEFHVLERFQRNNLPIFKGIHDPDGM